MGIGKKICIAVTEIGKMAKYIDADAYKKAHKNACETAIAEVGKGADTTFAIMVYEAVINSIDATPAADVAEVKRGRWERVGHWGRSYRCNQCGNTLDFDGVNVGRGDANYCPNCGARMDEVE